MGNKQQREFGESNVFCPRKKAWSGNKEEITLVWLTRTEIGDERDIILKNLYEINNYLITFNKPHDCIEYMRSIKNERIFLIIDGKLIIKLFEEIYTCNAIDSIYIFCLHHEKYDHLRKHPKIAGIFTQQSCLLNALRNGIETIEKQVVAFSRLDQSQNVFTKDLSRESASFLWFMLLFEVLEAMPVATKEERTTMLDLCAAYYRNNPTYLRDIDEFRHTYTEDQALSWYTRESFVYRLVNKALRVEDMELLFQFRFYIIDLCKQLKKGWLYAQSLGLTETTSIVYRGGKLAVNEINTLQSGHIITTNGFLSTTRNINIAYLFASKPTSNNSNYHAVIFHITIPENLTSLIFAHVNHKDTNFPDENEVIFSLGARFCVNQIYIDNEKSYLYHIDLTATDDGCEDINTFRVSLQRDLNETKAIFLFGRLLIDMDEIETAKNYFELLLERTSNDDQLDIATIHSYLGRIERHVQSTDKALFHHSIVLQIREKYLTLYHKDLAAAHNSLGLDYVYKPDNALALYHLQRALDIEMKLHGNENNTNISKILGHIGVAYLRDGNPKKASEYFQRALSIEQRLLPCEHIYIALRFEDVALCYEFQAEYTLALEYYRKALNIVERILPISHKRRRQILKGTLDTLCKSGAYTHAIEFALSILDDDTTVFKGWTMARLSELFLKTNDLNTAYKYFQDASNFYEKNRSSNLSVISNLEQKLKELKPSFLSTFESDQSP